MKLLRTSKFIDIEFDDADKLIKLIWKIETDGMTSSDFREEMEAYAEFFNLQPKLVLHEMRDMRFGIAPDDQIWLDNNINTKGVEAGVKKAAFVLSTDIFASVSVQQASSEKNIQPVEVEYFDSEAEAHNWLLS